MNLLTTSNKYVRSPLRYPGGKQKSISFLSKVINGFKERYGFNEFRDPFLGGGSVSLYALSMNLAEIYWANDANESLMDFWMQAQEDVNALCDMVESLKEPYEGSRKKSPQWTRFRVKYTKKLQSLPSDRLSRAARFFILNRSTSSGSTESGGMTPLAYCERFTESSIQRLRLLDSQLKNIFFSCHDYKSLLEGSGSNVFIFLDPPYFSAENSGLYGKNGNLHKGFDHFKLAENLRNCSHHWLMTIDNFHQINQLYQGWTSTVAWRKAYGMTNVNGAKSKIGSELLVANFDLEPFLLNEKDLEY
ncbi:MAG: DNA adenine methylase [Cyanobacteria bacterium P01_H01_bin.15]